MVIFEWVGATMVIKISKKTEVIKTETFWAPHSVVLPPMALAQVSASLTVFARDVCVISLAKSPATARLVSQSPLVPSRASFATGSPLLISTSYARKPVCKAVPVSIRCEQRTQGGNTVDVWLGRLAMVGFAVAITVEIATGKGLLENFGLTTPLPTVALAVTALVGVLTAVFIFQSASKN